MKERVELVEVRVRAGSEGRGKWEKERRAFFEDRFWSIEEIEEMRKREELRGEELKERERRMHKWDRWENIRGSNFFNRWFGRIKGKGVTGYLKKGWNKVRWQRIAKFRLGNGIGRRKRGRGGGVWFEGRVVGARVRGIYELGGRKGLIGDGGGYSEGDRRR